jgi:hypothetical protein
MRQQDARLLAQERKGRRHMAQVAENTQRSHSSAREGRGTGNMRRLRTFQADLSAEYSWDQLLPHQRRKAMAMVRYAAGQRKARLIAILAGLCVTLAILGVLLAMTFIR